MYDAYRLLESQNICLLCEFNEKTILGLRVPRSISIVQPDCTKPRSLPKDRFKQKVERELRGKELKPGKSSTSRCPRARSR